MKKISSFVEENKVLNYFFTEWLPWILWVVAVTFLAVLTTVVIHLTPLAEYDTTEEQESTPAALQQDSTDQTAEEMVKIPEYNPDKKIDAMEREPNLHMVIPSRSNLTAASYEVQKGDSIFAIATKFKLKPESVLWANYDLLKDDTDSLSVGQTLVIPPTDGIYYKWQKDDVLQTIADKYQVDPIDIASWPGNKLDLTNPEIKPDTYVMIPGGWRESQKWVIPTIWRPSAGATRSISSQCDLSESGAYGTGTFVWPTTNHYISGNNYTPTHLGIDIAAADGAPLYAADSGLVVYAGSIGGGYGIMVMIDHGNGYHTLYAHNSSLLVKCGQSVNKGQLIGYTGNTGNSTGPHLHFEIRYDNGWVNPLKYLN